MKRIRRLPEFEESFKNSINKEKSVKIVSVDGRTNENIVPGRSAFNQRKIPLRKELSGALLEHDYFGSHLDHKENTIDAELHCVTSVRIWSYSGPHFSRIFPYSARMWENAGKMRTRITPNRDALYAVLELKNIDHTCQVLAGIWNGMVIDLTDTQMSWNLH